MTTAASLLEWVRINKYCEMTGETPDMIDKRLRSGIWLYDIHAKRPEGSKALWINLAAVQDWVEGELPSRQHGKRKS